MVGSINMENEVGILSSTDLLSKVVYNLGLNVSYTKPYSLGYNLYSSLPIKIVPDSISLNNLQYEVFVNVKVDKKGNVSVNVETE